ncbi:MAG: hypothetical protein EXS64_16655 [Candidatus Latescibacteria bacterium]|nr:hypothetical protein [Candidatus Latescibacterota bacterium]
MSGVVHVIVFSNFEGFSKDPAPIIRWFDACSKAHPSVKWTHMYNPWYLLVKRPEVVRAEAGFSPYLLDVQANGAAEIGLHIHMFYDLIQQMGIDERACPFVNDETPSCDHPRPVSEDPQGRNGGYDVLMTGYSPEERATILDASVDAFLSRGFRRPTAFCAGYSAADPALQALLARRGFTTSFSAQAVGRKDYGRCWYRMLKWYGHITPLTLPYRVSQNSILPPPHKGDKYLDLVEAPLNLGVDGNDLYYGDAVVSREDMFDCHHTWAGENGKETAVAIGVHADVVGREGWPDGKVAQIVDRFLTHVALRAEEGGGGIRYGTASGVAKRFWENKTSGSVSGAHSTMSSDRAQDLAS